MPKLLRKLLALLMIVAVAPASASQFSGGAAAHRSDCPYERAEFAAAGYEPIDASVGEPSDGSLFDPGRRSSFLAP